MGYYERMLNDFDRQLPPRKLLKLTSVKITGIAGKCLCLLYVSERNASIEILFDRQVIGQL